MPTPKKTAKKTAKKRAKKKAPSLDQLIERFSDAALAVVDDCPPGQMNKAIAQMRGAFLIARRRGSLRYKQHRTSPPLAG